MSLSMPKTDENGWISTLNDRGYMSLSFDTYTQAFLAFCEKYPGISVFEAGASYGNASLAALARGAKVTANDLDKRHLDILAARTPLSSRSKLALKPGQFPHDVEFAEKSFDAILSSRMIHFLTGDEISLGMRKFYNWLKEGGKLFLIAETPYLRCYSDFISIYEERKKKGDKWPGLIEDTSSFQTIRYNNIPKLLHFLDPEVLKREAEEAGFRIESAGMIERGDFPPELRLDGRESVGLIAIKQAETLPLNLWR